MTDHANNAAATSAGWKREQLDRGVGFSPRYMTRYSKPLIGEPGSSGADIKHEAWSDVSQADADTKALTSLNGFRNLRYGAGAAAGTGGKGGALTFDLN